MSEVRLSGLSVAYGSKTAVADVSLQLATGTALALLGPSGSGKSSLLRAVAGLVPASAGSVWLGGKDQADVPTHRRHVGLMFQGHALFPHLNVAENVAFGLRMGKTPRPERTRLVDRMLALVGLADRAGAAVSDLSGGEQQRVALARTLAPRPQVVLLDEPLGSLDRALRVELLSTMKRAFQETGATVILVTHDQSEAFALGGQIGIMRAGELVQMGGQADIWAQPGDAWVAQFLGQHNVLARQSLPAGLLDHGRAGHELGDYVVLRPEKLRLERMESEAVRSDQDWRLPGRVIATEFRAGVTSVHVAVQDAQISTPIAVFVLVDPPGAGERVSVVVPTNAIVGLG
ncbi:MAG: ABC transporter ATP-binding protein [Actinomycetia bacterium]|nr:ABC transporter ATP-binding protein [Actinomycetes bacterium]